MAREKLKDWDKYGLDIFLKSNPLMSIYPSRNDDLILQGEFFFCAQIPNGSVVEASYQLKIMFTRNYPQSIPRVWETSKKIPSKDDFHINPDGSLCLGAPIRLLTIISRDSSFEAFAKNILTPFLYAVSQKIDTGNSFFMGELGHGKAGLIDDYQNLLNISGEENVKRAIKLLALKKRIRNKLKCPCGCNRRLGKCKFRYKINKLSKMASRSWFRSHLKNLGKGM